MINLFVVLARQSTQAGGPDSSEEPKNRFPAWRTGMINLFVVLARQSTQAGGPDSSINVYKYGLSSEVSQRT
jgi:hypothetical protein